MYHIYVFNIGHIFHSIIFSVFLAQIIHFRVTYCTYIYTVSPCMHNCLRSTEVRSYIWGNTYMWNCGVKSSLNMALKCLSFSQSKLVSRNNSLGPHKSSSTRQLHKVYNNWKDSVNLSKHFNNTKLIDIHFVLFLSLILIFCLSLF